MKKIISILAVILFLMVHVAAMGTNSAVSTTSYNPDQITNYKTKVITVAVTDDATGVTADFTESEVLGYFLCAMETVPNTTTPPTNDFDITLTTSGGFDILGGAGADRDSPTPNMAYPTIDSTTGQKGCVPVNGPLTMTFSGNSVDGGMVDINFFFTRP